MRQSRFVMQTDVIPNPHVPRWTYGIASMKLVKDNINPARSLGSAVAMAQVNQLGTHGPGLFSKILFATDEIRLVLVAMEPAIVLTHYFEGAVSIQSLSGTLSICVRGNRHWVNAGSILTLLPATKLAIQAREDVMFLVTMRTSSLWQIETGASYLS